MLLRRIAIAILRRRPEVDHRPVKPARDSIRKPKPGIRCDALSPTASHKQLVAHRPRHRDPAIDRAPALTAVDVLEADFIDTGSATVDISLHSDTPRSSRCVVHRH